MRLHHAIDLWSASRSEIDAKQASYDWFRRATLGLTIQAIPIKRVSNATSITYACAIAPRLASQPHHATTIATQLVKILRQALPGNHAPLLQGITVHATAAGFIYFEVDDRPIAAWLDLLLANALPNQPFIATDSMEAPARQLMLQSAAMFEVQHAHARCCSLLQLAHRERLIRLEGLEESPFYWRFSRSVSLSWLTSTDQLCFNHAADRCLLRQLFDAYDHLSNPSCHPASLLRSAQTVAQAFQVFHRVHPLWRQAPEELASTIVKLGLVMATQRILHLLLWHGLQLYPAVDF